jgi:predicted nucleic acid-binding protein/predicted RNA-binding protein with PUA-like domain
MRVLLDTNIFIYREDYNILSPNLSDLLKLFSAIKIEILVHPDSVDEINRDKNEERKRIMLSKIEAYPQLESPPDPISDHLFLKVVGSPSKANEFVDNKMLYAVYKNAVDFLITEDKGILGKALKLGIKNRVLSIEEALEHFREYIPKNLDTLPALREEYVYNLNLKDPFFDSLKREYPNFEQWFIKISREGRKCLVYLMDNGRIGALLIYKIEEEPIASFPPLPKERRLKLCTFKVEYEGYKIGEFFLKWSVQFSVKNNINTIYLTHFTRENDKLVELISDYGFKRQAKLLMGEDVYVKKLSPENKQRQGMTPLQIAKEYYPTFCDGYDVRKFIIPILPKYHNRLFTDFTGRQPEIQEYGGQLIIEGNTIRKAYLCHSNVKDMSKGDIVIFYCSKDLQKLTTLGTIEDVHYREKNVSRIKELIEKRTVYTIEEIGKMLKKPLTVILFKFHFHFPNPISLKDMKRYNIVSTAPRTILKIPHKRYLLIKKMCGIDERYTVD